MTEKTDSATGGDAVRGHVRERYGRIASANGSAGCSSSAPGCCGDSSVSVQLGYASGDLVSLPTGANLGLGCGNPTALLSLRPGEVVLDLGSGAGIDCFLASKKVGSRGRVIGVDMTPEMIAKARANARSGRYRNVEFRLGEIEHLPVTDDSVDVVISNCVINLSPVKAEIYREAFRVLRAGGRLAVSDVVATRPISRAERSSPSLWSSCSSGAIRAITHRTLLQRAGFEEIAIDVGAYETTPDSLKGQASMGVVPASIRATKPVR